MRAPFRPNAAEDDVATGGVDTSSLGASLSMADASGPEAGTGLASFGRNCASRARST